MVFEEGIYGVFKFWIRRRSIAKIIAQSTIIRSGDRWGDKYDNKRMPLFHLGSSKMVKVELMEVMFANDILIEWSKEETARQPEHIERRSKKDEHEDKVEQNKNGLWYQKIKHITSNWRDKCGPSWLQIFGSCHQKKWKAGCKNQPFVGRKIYLKKTSFSNSEVAKEVKVEVIRVVVVPNTIIPFHSHKNFAC